MEKQFINVLRNSHKDRNNKTKQTEILELKSKKNKAKHTMKHISHRRTDQEEEFVGSNKGYLKTYSRWKDCLCNLWDKIKREK